MSTTKALITARNELVALYPSVMDARRVVADAGLNPAFIDWGGSALNVWHSILIEAGRRNQVADIIEIASIEYPSRRARFDAILRDYRGDEGSSSVEADSRETGTQGGNYNIQIQGNVTGLVIGDDATVTQQFGPGERPKAAPPTAVDAYTSADRRASLEKLCAIHRRNLEILNSQRALFGAGAAPLHLLNQIDHEEQEIQRLQTELEDSAPA